jgi:tRNA(Arg) A34 adenosine deaminase TadA
MIAGIRRRTQRFMSLAMREAMKSSMKFRHGAVLAKGGKVVGVGHNHNRTCFKGLSVTSVHAEIEALDGKSLNTTSGMLAGDFTAP